jgi:hypothetical protein
MLAADASRRDRVAAADDDADEGAEGVSARLASRPLRLVSGQ